MKKHIIVLVWLAAAALMAAASPVCVFAAGAAAAGTPDTETASQDAQPDTSVDTSAVTTADQPGTAAGPGVKLTWGKPKDISDDRIAGYNVYRSESILGHYEKANREPVSGLVFEDRGLVRGKLYYYKVSTVFADGTLSAPTEPVGIEAGGKYGAAAQRLPDIRFFTSNAFDGVIYLGEEAIFVLGGDPGMSATFVIEGVTDEMPMEEMEPGSYRGVFVVTEGMRVKNAAAQATLSDGAGGKDIERTPAVISLLGQPKPSLSGLYAGIVEPDRVGLNWPKSGDTAGHYNLYRDKGRIVGTDGMTPLSGNINKVIAAYIDTDVSPGSTYYYVLASVGADGTVSAVSENLEVVVPEAVRTSGIELVEEDSGGEPLAPGDVLSVTVRAAAGGKAFFSLATAARDVAMTESAAGVYGASYTVREGDGVFRSRVSVSFRDTGGKASFSNSATFVSVDAPKAATAGSAPSGDSPIVESVSDDIMSVVGISGRLTAGKTFTVTLKGAPGNKAYFSVGEAIWKVPMIEDPAAPGVYTGRYTVRPGDSVGMDPDDFERVYVTGYLESPAGAVSAPVASAMPVVVDTSCDILVEVDKDNLPADTMSQTKVGFTVTDADGEPVADRRLTVIIEPPPGYTGVMGGGGMAPAFTDSQEPEHGALGRIEVDFDNLTDAFGKMSATYTAGFAAKTAMIAARDFSTGSVGFAYVTTGISSSVNVTLDDPLPGAGPVVAPGEPVYQIDLEFVPDPTNPPMTYGNFMLDAAPDVLTADGVSRANIIATLTADGEPVQGKTLLFAVTGAGGRLTKSSAVTDSAGRAQVFYIAGTRAGKALVTATEPASGITATKLITLMADAPARIYASAQPDTIPADGFSTSRIVVEITDVNQNPTENVGVRFALGGGPSAGRIETDSAVTDFRGACDFLYTAGTVPGVVTIDISASSVPPTAEQMQEAYSRVVAPLVYDYTGLTELRVVEWYKQVGESAGRGEPLALVETAMGNVVVYAPVTGTVDRITVGPGIYVMEGKEIGMMR